MLKSAKSCAVALTLSLFHSQAARAAYNLNFQEPATRVAREVYDLHTLIMVIIGLIGLAVFAAMFYSIYAHRKSKGHQAAQFHENTTVEVVWTVVPFFILIGMAYPATKAVLMQKDTASPDITIKTTGYQWKWGYDYLKGEGEGIHFVSNLSTPRDQIEGKAAKGEHYLLEVDNPMVVPVEKRVRVLVTANDVIHSWWVPMLGVKQDANPGFIRDTWFRAEKEGVYRGNCAELCGKEHGFMPIEVHAVSAEKYTAWVEEQKKKIAAAADDPNKTYTMEELKQRGEKVYAANCVACHQANGKGVPPAFPALDGSKISLGPMGAHIDMVLNGKPGTAMAAFKQLNDVEIAALVTYERNAWGNKAGDMAQPADIRSIRAGGKVEPKAAAAPAAEPTRAAASPAGLPARIFFEIGKVELPGDATDAISAVAEYVKADASAKVDITGDTDKTGNVDKNLELAKERAKAVREALKAAGIPADRINMKPPATVTGSGADKDARRVEINAAS